MRRPSTLAKILIAVLLWQTGAVVSDADDTCTFMTTANDISPNIVILLDNGAAMEEIVWHPDYNNSIDYTPNLSTKVDIVENGVGNGFYRNKGYSIIKHGSDYYLVEIPDDLVVANHRFSRKADAPGTSPTWTINGRTITLPAFPSKTEVNSVIDNATNFRYSKNYLNWLFYTNSGSISSGLVTYSPPLPAKTRFYYAKSALMTIAKMAANKAIFSIYNFTANASGASNVQPLGLVVNTPLAANPEDNTLNSSYVNNVNNMGTVTYSPLAEGLATIGGYYSSPSSHVVGYYCQKNFAIVVSPGVSSEDKSPAAGSSPSSLSDYDNDSSDPGEGYIRENTDLYGIPINLNGTTYLDDVACFLYKNDIVGYQPGFQNVFTYTVGFMGDKVGNLFLINTSNNGNGNFKLYDTTHKDYGKYHYVAQNPDELAAKLLAAVNDIISKTNSFTAPVVPVTRTTSGNRIYMAFFKPDKDNFWEGNVTKYALSANLSIVDRNGDPATYPNGAIIEDSVPFWQTKDWATPDKPNYIHNNSRRIYTYLGVTKDLTDLANAFNTTNITTTHLGNPILPKEKIINFVRGADVFDQDNDNDTTENRIVITGDVLHSEPLVFHYRYSDGSMKSYVFFGSNDGMLHAVKDAVVTSSSEINYGEEAWAFIPPDLLPKMKNMVEGTSHQYYVDSSPKAYFKDDNKNGNVDETDKVILVCGERKGGTGYFALDVTNPESPRYLWRIDNVSNPSVPPPETVLSDLGQSWSEPQLGLVKTTSSDTIGMPVMFIGGGYSSNNSSGRAVHVIKVLTGEILKTFKNDGSTITEMIYSIPSDVLVVDANDNGFIDKVYVGDLGSQMWRLGKFTSPTGTPYRFPDCDENILNWEAQIVFVADPLHTRSFYYPPSLTLEKGYDLLFFGTGDRENACSTTTADKFFCIRDKHQFSAYSENDLVDMTNPLSTKPSLDNLSSDVNNDGRIDQGWFIQLGVGEKVVAENTIYYKTVYFTTFTPNPTPCVPGGDGRVYALQYKTSANVLDIDKDGSVDRSIVIGGGIPSKIVTIITDTLVPSKMLISVGSTNPDDESLSVGAGVRGLDPLTPDANFLYRWWRELTNL